MLKHWMPILILAPLSFFVYGADQTVRVPDSWVVDRVERAKVRLGKSEAGKKVWKAIEKHGGLKNWYEKGSFAFNFEYVPTGKGKRRNTYQKIDIWSSKARHQADDGVQFGWDGKKAWFNKESKYNARFWSLTPYYFLAVPFVFADDGITYREINSLKFEGKKYYQVKITYGEGVGDSPDDFYVLLLSAEDYSVLGVRYIVTYKGFFKEGESSPEKILLFEDLKEVDEILLAQKMRSYNWSTSWDELGKMEVTNRSVAASVKISKLSFDQNLAKSYFSKPKGSIFQEEW